MSSDSFGRPATQVGVTAGLMGHNADSTGSAHACAALLPLVLLHCAPLLLPVQPADPRFSSFPQLLLPFIAAASDFRDMTPQPLQKVYELYQPVVQEGRWTEGLLEMW
jgi:hypothetical protein